MARERVYIVGPRKAQNQLFASYLEGQTGIDCRQVSSREELLQLFAQESTGRELILKDCAGLDNGSLHERLRNLTSQVTVDLLAVFNLVPGTGVEKEAYSWGVKGFFYDSDEPSTLVKGIEALFRGELWMTRRIMAECLRQGGNQRSVRRGASAVLLTARELDVLAKLAQGAPNKDIAEGLCVSHHTVKTHLYRIFRKIGAKNRHQATLWASSNL